MIELVVVWFVVDVMMLDGFDRLKVYLDEEYVVFYSKDMGKVLVLFGEFYIIIVEIVNYKVFMGMVCLFVLCLLLIIVFYVKCFDIVCESYFYGVLMEVFICKDVIVVEEI